MFRFRLILLILIVAGIGVRFAVAAPAATPSSLEREQSAVNALLHFDYTARRWIGDYHGQYINITDGWRSVTDAPAHAVHTLWLFGSSTIRDMQVPDSLTKASYLQRDLNAYGYSLRVVNRGDDGVGVADSLLYLKEAAIKPGDLVVFYGGGHDPLIYGATMAQMAIVAKSDGAAFYAFLEAQIWSAPLSSAEASLLASLSYETPAAQADIMHRWTLLQPAARQLATHSIASYDLTHALDAARASGVVVYVDHIHMNEFGNAIIARAIADAITVF